MSRIIASAGIRGAHQLVDLADAKLREAIESKGEDCAVEFPNTGYYLPIIYSMTGESVETLGQMEKTLDSCKELLPPVPKGSVWLPYLGQALDAGMATLFAEEVDGAELVVVGAAAPHGGVDPAVGARAAEQLFRSSLVDAVDHLASVDVEAVVVDFGRDGELTFAGQDLGAGCVFRAGTGVECPFCGMSRSFVAFANGDVTGSFSYHLLGPIVATSFAAFIFAVFTA